MREQYGHPGQFESLSPFHAWIADHIDELANDFSGNVESPTGWFAYVECEHVTPSRRRSFLVRTDERGFHYVEEFADFHAAGVEFDKLSAEFDTWDTDGDDGDDGPEPPNAYACNDCVSFHANGDTSGIESEERVAEVVAAEGLADGEYVIVGEPAGFRWNGCDVCGSRLGGDSHHVWILKA